VGVFGKHQYYLEDFRPVVTRYGPDIADSSTKTLANDFLTSVLSHSEASNPMWGKKDLSFLLNHPSSMAYPSHVKHPTRNPSIGVVHAIIWLLGGVSSV
jgi:hypothetical protein